MRIPILPALRNLGRHGGALVVVLGLSVYEARV
jgi:hypothetical protein